MKEAAGSPTTMRLCDLTLAYTETSGGVRRYIDQKRRHLLKNTAHEHVLVIPGETDAVEHEGRLTTYHIASPPIPGCEPYRFFWRPDKIKEALTEARVDVIELGSFYVCPWAAFSYRKSRARHHQKCLVAGYFHTDIAHAYVGAPIETRLAESLGHWSETLQDLGMRIAHAAEVEAQEYFNGIFERCDLIMAATEHQAERVREYGVDRVDIVPLGVDVALFHPSRRDNARRQELGIGPTDPMLVYAGRFDAEKHVRVLPEAHAMLPDDFGAHLVLVGHGPLRPELEKRAATQPRLHVLPYQREDAQLARLLATADAYLTAGPHETFGLSVVEAQACGLPVIGVNAGALRERVLDGLGYLAPVDDPAAMAQLIRRAYADRNAIGRRARAHAVESFDWETTFDTLLDLYEDRLGTPQPPSERSPHHLSEQDIPSEKRCQSANAISGGSRTTRITRKTT